MKKGHTLFKKNKNLFVYSSWTALSTIVLALTQILRLSILARFLEKSDFGIVAILTLILGLTFTFSDIGFSVAVMHKRDLSRNEFSSLYWLQLLFFFIIYLIVISFSNLISSFYEAPEIVPLLPLALADLLFQGVGKLYDTLLLKEFQFKTIAVRNIVTSFLSLILAVILAVKGYGVLSLVLSTLFQSASLNIWNFLVGQKQIPIRLYCSPKPIWGLVKIGAYQTGTQILDYVAAKLDVLIIGKILGMESLGIYNLAKEIVMKEIIFTNTIANKVALPYFSLMQADKMKIRNNYCKLLNIISLPNFLFSTLLCVLSVHLVSILYGQGYEDVAPVMSILAIWAMVSCVGNPVGNVVVSLGRTDLSFRYTIVRFLIYLPITYIACSLGLIFLSFGQVLLGVISITLTWKMILCRAIRLGFCQFISSFMYQGLVSITLCVVGYYIANLNLLGFENNIVALLGYGIPIMLLYIFILLKPIRNTLSTFV